MVSVLRRELHAEKSFADFYTAWLPSKEMCDEITVNGATFQQHFPLPVRVINATNMQKPNEIISIGIIWAATEAEQQAVLDYIAKAHDGEDTHNETRHARIEQAARR